MGDVLAGPNTSLPKIAHNFSFLIPQNNNKEQEIYEEQNETRKKKKAQTAPRREGIKTVVSFCFNPPLSGEVSQLRPAEVMAAPSGLRWAKAGGRRGG